MRALLTIMGMLAIAACAAAAEVDWSYETAVRADTPAGDFKGITGTVERISLPSELVTAREIEVWLPPSYATSPDRHYPVLYMHDGQNVFDPEQSEYSGWDWGVDEAMTALGLEAIIVAPHSDSGTRNQDYFPENAAETHAQDFRREFGDFNPAELNANNYLRYLVTEVKPHIDTSYRTQPGRETTMIMGSSMGGLISLYAISEYPEVFGAAGMVSTHFPLGNGALVDYFSTRLPDPAMHRLYFDFGTKTLDHNYEGHQDRMDRALEAVGYERGVNWTTRKFEGDDHSERAWRNRVHVPLQFLIAGESVDGGEER